MRKDKIKCIVFIASGLIFLMSAFLFAELSDEKIKIITQRIQEECNSWTQEETLEFISTPGPKDLVFGGDKGVVQLKKMGDTILLNGKDITGNLGSKTTYGDKSPIIETKDNSLVTTGDRSPISQKITVYNFFIHMTLSVSLVLNFYLFYKLKRKNK